MSWYRALHARMGWDGSVEWDVVKVRRNHTAPWTDPDGDGDDGLENWEPEYDPKDWEPEPE